MLMDVEKYKSQTVSPNMFKQTFANFKRRLLCYIYQPKEIILNVQMVMLMLIEIIIISTLVKIITK